MSLMLPDEESRKVAPSMWDSLCPCFICEKSREELRAIARAQARHMARECLDWWEGEADCYNVNQRKHFEAWLRQEGVM
jgi:hypothetical protein